MVYRFRAHIFWDSDPASMYYSPVDAQGSPLPPINFHKEQDGVYIYLSFLHKQHRDIFESEKYKSRIEP